MIIKSLTIFFILSVLTSCATSSLPPVGVGDPELVYKQSARVSQIDVMATASLRFVSMISGWTPERKAYYNAYYAYYQAATNSIAKGDVKGFTTFMDAAEKQLKLLVSEPSL